MDLQPYLDFLASRPFSVVFCASLIEAAGVPFPSRLLLVLTPAFLATDSDLARLVLVATVGAVLGDHVPLVAGRLAGTRLLGLYCRLTLASDSCLQTTLRYFQRFGAAALLFNRFSTSLRLFASACAACGRVSYPRYVSFDLAGTLCYTTLFVLIGALVGERAVVFLTRDPRRFLFLGVAVLAFLTVIGYRLWRRRRSGGAEARRVAQVPPLV